MFKLPNDIKYLSQDIQDKLDKLQKERPLEYAEWVNLFKDCNSKKVAYEKLQKSSQGSKITDSEFIAAMTLLDKQETDILESERDLLQRLGEDTDSTTSPDDEFKEAIRKAKGLTGQGSVIIRPKSSGVIKPPTKPRRFRR